MDDDEGRVGQGGEPPRPLVTVERQVEQDLATGETVTRRFVKMYFEARESGLLADIPDDLWKTLCALATYLNEDSECWASQETLGRDMGVSRQAANGRVKRLLAYRFNGRPVISVRRERVRAKKGQTRWGSNVYRLLPITGFHVGRGQPGETEVSMSGQPDVENSPSVSGQADIEQAPEIAQASSHADFSMSGSMSSLGRHEQEGTRVSRDTHTPPDDGCVLKADARGGERELVSVFHQKRGSAKSRRPTPRELEQAGDLIGRLGVEAARFVVEFALSEAPKTNFEMKHFGAVLGYEGDALAKRQEHEKALVRRAQEERKAALKRLEERYMRWRHQVVIEAVDATPPERLSALEARVREKLGAELGVETWGFETRVKLEIRELVAAEKAIPSFEDWYRAEREGRRAASSPHGSPGLEANEAQRGGHPRLGVADELR